VSELLSTLSTEQAATISSFRRAPNPSALPAQTKDRHHHDHHHVCLQQSEDPKLRMLTLPRGKTTSDWGLVATQRESFLKNRSVELNKPVDRQITRIEYPPSLDNDSKVGPKNLCNRQPPPVIPVRKEKSRTTLPDLPRLQHVK
jgi:hypothetical protein